VWELMGQDKLFAKRKTELTRKEKTRNIRVILIVCEGEKTEPNYFKAFPVKPEVCDSIDIQGKGYNTVSLVNEAILLRDNAERAGKRYVEIWCVFDKDSFSDKNFNDAIKLAGSEKIQCAYSIEAFELWYLLHFQYCDSQLHRTQYARKLEKQMKKPYRKNDPDMFSVLLKNQKTAIKNAKRLWAEKANLPCHRQNPVTTVFKLVLKLNGE
jgi:hypothetical protein